MGILDLFSISSHRSNSREFFETDQSKSVTIDKVNVTSIDYNRFESPELASDATIQDQPLPASVSVSFQKNYEGEEEKVDT